MRIIRLVQCSAFVTPGEYVIDRWDNKRCTETNPMHIIKCDACNLDFCLDLHWHKHLESVPPDHFERATQ